jgi:predicted pyridoxine 5'-phosphate oxidase superfamily flavin-nucleotide-binding protein
MPERVSDIAFTASIKAEQARRGSREKLEKMAGKRDWRDTVTEDLAAFIAERDSFYLATASAAGQPYIQHRGGPKGFLHVIDEKTLGFADFAGNRHYVTLGNLAENDRAHIFLMDYAGRQRVKLWGTAKVVEDGADLLARLAPEGYKARPERVILFTITAIDINCPQHIVQRFDEATVRLATEKLAARVAELEAENKALRRELAARA